MSISVSRVPSRHRMCWFYAEKNGGPVLIENSSWTKINGFLISGSWGKVMVTFRRNQK